MGTDDKLVLIRRNDFLAKLSDDEYESLNIAHNVVTANRNAYIYFDPQQLNKLYFVKEGYVKLGSIDDAGNEIIREILKPGDVFGQLTLEQENMSGEYAQAYKTGVSLCAFSIADFEKLLGQRPELSIEYSKKVGRQLRRLDNRLTNLLQKDVRSRLLYFFWTLLQGKQVEPGHTIIIHNYFTHEDIAHLTGTTRQTVTTLLGQLTEEGIIDIDRKNIVIKDLKQLQTAVGMG